MLIIYLHTHYSLISIKYNLKNLIKENYKLVNSKDIYNNINFSEKI